jgi:hypothetical protein
MASRQLHLLDPPNPLLERFGEDFFLAVPRCPGIYIMTGENERVLYVGQSKNLRSRLSSYKNARPDRVSRKTVRLIRQVKRITWETCATPIAAQLRENALLRLYRPKFNVQNTYPQAYSFIWVRYDLRELELGRTHDPEACPRNSVGVTLYGAFKTRAVAGFTALLRLLWGALHQPATLHDFPSRLLIGKSPRQFCLKLPPTDLASQLVKSLHQCFEGGSDCLFNLLAEMLPANASLSPFHLALQTSDLETLAEFYRSGPQRNFQLKEKHQLQCPLIPQEQLDDLLVLTPIRIASPPSQNKTL